ncbi:MAG: RHS repeat-associated core domain-containing protein [Alphaproteobacteria bacterium]
MSDLYAGNNNGVTSVAYGVNNYGQVVGTMPVTVNDANNSPHPFTHAFSWQGSVTDLTPNYYGNSAAYGINDAGQIVGTIGTAGVKWQGGSSSTLPSGTSTPAMINNVGQIVGTYSSGGSSHAFLVQSGTLTDLGAIQGSTPVRINNKGQVTGGFYNTGAGQYYPSVWQNGVVVTIPTLSGIPAGWSITSINGINDSGTVVGQGTLSGSSRGFYLTSPQLLNYAIAGKPYDPKANGGEDSASTPTDDLCGTHGMCVPNAQLLSASLNLNDTPIGYQPPKGPPAYIRLTYNHRDSVAPSSTSSHVGPNWTLNVISYIQDDPASPGQSVTRNVAGGGIVDYTFEAGQFNTTTGAFGPEKQTGAILKRTPATGFSASASYELSFPDGAKQIFSYPDGSFNYPRRAFLTDIVDASGQGLHFGYNYLQGTFGAINCTPGCPQLQSVSDANFRATNFVYGDASNVLRVTRINDPFGRHADLAYDGSGRLSSITDVIGIQSSFTYDTTDPTFIKKLTTPYGDSNFVFGQDTATDRRWLTLSDAVGNTEKVEYRGSSASGIAACDKNTSDASCSVSTSVPTGMPNGINNADLDKRNTFVWNKWMYANGYGSDYTQANVTHWLKDGAGNPVGIPESVKPLYESRIWYNYPGQNDPSTPGTLSVPRATGRVITDPLYGQAPQNQVYQSQYNSLGKPTLTVDPYKVSGNNNEGRTTRMTYDASGVDLLTVEQKTGSGTPGTWATIASYVYTDPTEQPTSIHKPIRYTDAAGQTYKFKYNGDGQLIYAANPYNDTTYNEYHPSGKLLRTTMPVPSVNWNTIDYGTDINGAPTGASNSSALRDTAITYDSADRPYDVTDRMGLVKRFGYDNLDRVTRVDYAPGTAGTTYETNTYTNLDLTSHRDRLGRVSTDVYTANRQLWLSFNASGTRRGFTYYPNGALQGYYDENDHPTIYGIDGQGRANAVVYPNGNQTNYYYDDGGRMRTIVDLDGSNQRWRNIKYNVDNSVHIRDYTNPANPSDPVVLATTTATFTYDPWFPGQMTSMADASGTTNYTYKTVGTVGALQLATENPPTVSGDADKITYTYDQKGRLASRQIGIGTASVLPQESWVRDTYGRINRHIIPDGNLFYYDFNGASNQVTMRAFRNQALTEIDPLNTRTMMSYDTAANDSRLLTINNPPYDNSAPGARDFTLNWGSSPANPYVPATITDSAGGPGGAWGQRVWTMGYDARDRLTSAVAADRSYSFTLDAPGNATSFTSTHYPSGGLYSFNSTYNTSNQMTVANGNALIYDPYGNLVTHTNYRSFKYDAENRLIEVDFPAAPADKVEMQYDGLGRRTQIKSTIGGVVTTRNLQWCAQTTSPPFQGAAEEICVERDASGGMQRMVYPEGEYRANGGRYFYERDQTGNIRDVMKMAAGLTTAARDSSFNYTPYGGVDGKDGTAEPLQQFAGLLYEKNSNLFLSRTRAYAPWIGRWLQRDPIGQNGGSNVYEYAGASPINKIDPSGLQGVRPGLIETMRPTIGVPPAAGINEGAGNYADYLQENGEMMGDLATLYRATSAAVAGASNQSMREDIEKAKVCTSFGNSMSADQPLWCGPGGCADSVRQQWLDATGGLVYPQIIESFKKRFEPAPSRLVSTPMRGNDFGNSVLFPNVGPG